MKNKKLTVLETIEALLEALVPDFLKDPNFVKTPQRVEAYLKSHFLSAVETDKELKKLTKAVFPSPVTEKITQRGIKVFGLCPHHLLPVHYTVAVSYLPHGKVIGLSKLSRVVDICLRRPVLQETGTVDIANAMVALLGTDSVAVLVEGQHSCMAIRGVRQTTSDTVTVELRGSFLSQVALRAEFYSIVGRR